MSSIGPQLPPQLTKRKRTPDDESPDSPAPKLQATDRNKDEIDLSSDDEDSYGPSAPKSTATAPIGPIGPSLPPSNTDEINLDDSDDDDIGPSAPPPPTTTRPSIGPTLPPANQDEIPLEDDDDSEDDAGPAPQPGPTPAPAPAPTSTIAKRATTTTTTARALPSSSSHLARQTQARAASEAARAAEEAAGPRRDDWMLAPPTSSGYRAPDPTKLKNRRFTEATRGKSLYEEHQQSRKGRTLAPDEEEDDPSKRAFDREKDMKLGGRIGTAQRRELLNRAADFGGRFSKGKYL
ncbi:hypothetical protein K449DRAFT_381005 [Hypoxylon sp. EC38]|nr:hypothetical protein K449DRAFT_381005 [Hypoxylon sp. EC38]